MERSPVGRSTHAADVAGFWSLQPNPNTLSSAGSSNVRVCAAAQRTVATPAPGNSGPSRCSKNASVCSRVGLKIAPSSSRLPAPSART